MGVPCSPPQSPVLQEWPKHWKAKLKRSPGDLSLVTSLVSHLLRYRVRRPRPLAAGRPRRGRGDGAVLPGPRCPMVFQGISLLPPRGGPDYLQRFLRRKE